MRIHPVITWLCVSLFLVSLPATIAVASSGADIVRVGILAKNGLEQCKTRWQATADYLSEKITPYRFVKELNLTPYAPNNKTDLNAFYHRYEKWIVVGIVVGCVILFALFFCAVYVAKLNSRLSKINADLIAEIKTRKNVECGLEESEYNLESALTAANEANKSKADFLANMSHELRTPMNGIIGITSILSNLNLNDEQAEYTNIIMKSADGLLSIINDILDYSQIEAGRSKMEVVDFTLYAIVNNVMESFATQATDKGLGIRHQVADNVPAYLKGDERRIEKIIRILIRNAVKFTHEGMVSLTINLAESDDTHCSLRIEVQDTGIGIAPDQEKQIFDPFFQIDYSSTRKYGGTGLGLSLAKHFAEMMGGAIGVKSKPAKGSTFWFTVRLERQTTIPIRQTKLMAITSAQPVPDEKKEQEEAGGPRILVVEDNAINQKVMTKILSSNGYRSKVVDNGRKAVIALSEQYYDLVLMDLQMPVMNGFEATSAIRNPSNKSLVPQVPIIAVTANVSKGDRKKCLDAGMDDYIPKPVNPTLLLEKIAYWHPKSHTFANSANGTTD